MVAGCTAVTSAAPHHAGPSRSPGPARSSGRSSLAAPASPAPKPKPAVIPASVVVSSFRAADGSVITLGEFRGAATFRLHSGSEDPGYPALSSLRAGPTVTGGGGRRLIRARNGRGAHRPTRRPLITSRGT